MFKTLCALCVVMHKFNFYNTFLKFIIRIIGNKIILPMCDDVVALLRWYKMKNSKSVTISVDSFRLLIKCIKRYQSDLEDVIELYKDVDFETLHPNVKKRIGEAHETLPHLENLELELYGFGG